MPGEPTLVDMFKNVLIGQQRREGVLVREIQQLKTAITVPNITTSPISQNANPPLNLPSDGILRVQTHTATPRSQASTPNPPPSPSRDSSNTPLRPGPKMLPFHEGEDIENFLVRFERIARTWGWPPSEWACRLIPLLTGKALDAYSAMEEDNSNVYASLKEALLAKCYISPEIQTSVPVNLHSPW